MNGNHLETLLNDDASANPTPKATPMQVFIYRALERLGVPEERMGEAYAKLHEKTYGGSPMRSETILCNTPTGNLDINFLDIRTYLASKLFHDFAQEGLLSSRPTYLEIAKETGYKSMIGARRGIERLPNKILGGRTRYQAEWIIDPITSEKMSKIEEFWEAKRREEINLRQEDRRVEESHPVERPKRDDKYILNKIAAEITDNEDDARSLDIIIKNVSEEDNNTTFPTRSGRRIKVRNIRAWLAYSTRNDHRGEDDFEEFARLMQEIGYQTINRALSEADQVEKAYKAWLEENDVVLKKQRS
jgi:hypothetical protein